MNRTEPKERSGVRLPTIKRLEAAGDDLGGRLKG